MKKHIILAGLAAISALALSGCVRDISEPETIKADSSSSAVPFSIYLNLSSTRTATDADLKSTWSKDDSICVFHAEAGTTEYVNDGKFVVESEGATGCFKGLLAQELQDGKSYDWYVVYPYSQACTSPAEVFVDYRNSVSGKNESATSGGTQNICNLPLWSSVKNVANDSTFAFNMHQFFSLAKLTISNYNTDIDLDIANFGMAMTQSYSTDTLPVTMYGDITADITGAAPELTFPDGKYYPQNAQVSFGGQGQVVEKGESRTQYLPVYPMTVPAGARVNFYTSGYWENTKCVTLSKGLEFKAGQVTEITVKFDYDEYFITEEEAAEPVLFRFCYSGDQKISGSWNGNTKPMYYSVLGHESYLSLNYEGLGSYTFSKAWITTSNTVAEAVNMGNNGGRYYLPLAKLVNGNSFKICANYAKLPAGKKLAFYTSVQTLKHAQGVLMSAEYSFDGGKTFKPASLNVAAESDSVYDKNKVFFKYMGDNLCHPIVIESDPIESEITNAEVIFKLTCLQDNPASNVGTLLCLAPFYDYDPEFGFRVYTKSSKPSGQKYPWEWIATAVYDHADPSTNPTYYGDISDITGSAYFKLVDNQVQGGIDPWTPGENPVVY